MGTHAAGHEPFPGLVARTHPTSVALETTLLLHGVPPGAALALQADLAQDVTLGGGAPCLVGVVAGRPIVGMDDAELATLLSAGSVPKANTSNLGVLLHQGSHAATTVSTTMELAAAAGVRIFATGGIGGVHQGYGTRWDISSDLAALARFPVAVVASGVKSILDVEATREALETLGVPVVGFGSERFPAFYQRQSAAGVDATFHDVESLASFVEAELARTRRGVLITNPIAPEDEIPEAVFAGWLDRVRAMAEAKGVQGRGVTPFVLGHLHAISQGATLRANIALVRSNARLAGRLAGCLAKSGARQGGQAS